MEKPYNVRITRLAPGRYRVRWVCPCGRSCEERRHTDAMVSEIWAEIRAYTDCPGCRRKAGA